MQTERLEELLPVVAHGAIGAEDPCALTQRHMRQLIGLGQAALDYLCALTRQTGAALVRSEYARARVCACVVGGLRSRAGYAAGSGAACGRTRPRRPLTVTLPGRGGGAMRILRRMACGRAEPLSPLYHAGPIVLTRPAGSRSRRAQGRQPAHP